MDKTVMDTSPPVDWRHYSLLSVRSIIVGWFVAMGIAWLLYVLGLAVGFSAFDVSDADATAKGLGAGTIVWVVLTSVVSLFLGGMFASWMDGRPDQTVGTLHGVAVWALAMSVTAFMAAAGLGGLFQGGASLLRGASTAGVGIAGAARGADANSPLAHATGALGAQINRAASQSSPRPEGTTSGGASTSPSASGTTAASSARADLTASSTSAIAADLLKGKTDDAKARLVADSGLQPAEADSVMQALTPSVERYKTEVRDAAEQARRYSAAAIWAAFIGSFVALIAAAIGGWAGAGHIHRVHDRRVYPGLSRST